jgi:hypothetical protein
MTLSPLAIAVQGIGFNPLLIALNGFADAGEAANVLPGYWENMSIRPKKKAPEQKPAQVDENEELALLLLLVA